MKAWFLALLHRRRLPLAWLLLKRQPGRLLTAVLGVAFAAMLILMQLAIQDALYNSSISILNKFDTDLVLMSRRSATLIGLASFRESRLASAFSTKAVAEVYPVRWRYVKWRLPEQAIGRLAIAIGVRPSKASFTDPAITGQLAKLTIPGRILYDDLSRTEFGPVAAEFRQGRTVVAYADDQRLRVAGLVRIGPSFGYDCSFITNIATIDAIYPDSEGDIELGLVKLVKGADLQAAAAEIASQLPEDLLVTSRQALVDLEKSYWANSKPIGFVFLFCATLGLAVGAMMVYQLLSMDVGAHLPAYATLTSMGFERSRLEAIVFTQGLILSAIGFPLAWLASLLLCRLITSNTSLPMALPFNTAAMTFLLIVLMCSSSSLFAMGKLRDADPCDLFG